MYFSWYFYSEIFLIRFYSEIFQMINIKLFNIKISEK